MTKTDLSTKVLLVRKMFAEKATPGPWLINDRITSTPFDISIKNGTCFCQIAWATKRQDSAHIAANDPPTVIATIDELLRLREENERMQSMIAALARKVANLTRGWAKAGNVDNSAGYWVSWARHDAKAARRAVEEA